MEITITPYLNGALLHITGAMTIYEAMALQANFLDALDKHQQLSLNLSEVSEFDLSALQLLMLLKKIAEQQHKSIRIEEASPTVMEALSLCHLGSFFGLSAAHGG